MTDTLDPRVALALGALAEITDPEDVGPLLDAEVVEPGVVDLRFACLLPGYAAWHWTVSTADLPGSEPTVLEVELLPGADALLAPPWTPWTERLAEWRRQHPDELHPGEDDPEDEVDAAADEDEDEDLDEDDLAVDDALDVLDEAELAAAEAPADRDDDESDDEDDDDDSDEGPDDDAASDDGDSEDSDEDRPAAAEAPRRRRRRAGRDQGRPASGGR